MNIYIQQQFISLTNIIWIGDLDTGLLNEIDTVDLDLPAVMVRKGDDMIIGSTSTSGKIIGPIRIGPSEDSAVGTSVGQLIDLLVA